MRRLCAIAGLLLLWTTTADARPSTYSRMGWGAKALYMLLEDLGYQTSRFYNPDEPGEAQVVVVLGGINEAKQDSILRWVRKGHLALVALPRWGKKGLCEKSSFSSISFRRQGVWEKANTKHADLIIRPSSCVMRVPDKATLLAGTEEAAVAMEVPAGDGKLLVLAHDDLITNENLNRDDLVVLIRRWMFNNAPARGRVAFLEEPHGGGGMGLVKMLNRAGLSAFLLHALLWLLLLYWCKGPRFGDPTPVFVETRREFSQHARALGHLYQHRRASGHALRQQYERFLDRLLGRPDMSQIRLGATVGSAAARTRLRQNRSALAALIATRTGREAASVESLLAQIEYTISAPGPSDAKDVQRNFRLSQALAELQHTTAGKTAGRTSGDRRGRTEIR